MYISGIYFSLLRKVFLYKIIWLWLSFDRKTQNFIQQRLLYPEIYSF